MRGAPRVTVLGAMALVAACSEVVAPDQQPTIQPIVLTVPVRFQGVLSHVNRVHVRVTRPHRPPRDTVLSPLFRGGRVHVRAVLRPDEGEFGTTVDVDLKQHASFLFRGSVVVGAQSGWPFEVRVPVTPIAVLDAGADQLLTIGDVVDLRRNARITFQEGTVATPEGVAWLTSDESILRMDGGTATAAGVGEATVLGVWYGQVDTVAFEVRPVESIRVPDTRWPSGAWPIRTASPTAGR